MQDPLQHQWGQNPKKESDSLNQRQSASNNQSQQQLSQNKLSRYDEVDLDKEDEMMKSSSSFGLPSDSYNDNISDKEIMSDRGAAASGAYNSNKKKQYSPVRQQNQNVTNFESNHQQNKQSKGFNSTQKPYENGNINLNGTQEPNLDVSFEFLDETKKNANQIKQQQLNIYNEQKRKLDQIEDLSDMIDSPGLNKNGLNLGGANKMNSLTENNNTAKFRLPLYHNQHQQSLDQTTKRNDEKEITRSTVLNSNNLNLQINIQNLKQSQLAKNQVTTAKQNNLLSKQQQQQEKQNKNKIISQNVFGKSNNQSDQNQFSKFERSPQQNDKNKNRNNPLQNLTFEQEYPTFLNNRKEPVNNVNDDSYISANSGVNLITGNFDNSFIISDSKNMSQTLNQTQLTGQRIINNNYQNIVNMRQQTTNEIKTQPSLQNGFLQKVINNHNSRQIPVNQTQSLSLTNPNQNNVLGKKNPAFGTQKSQRLTKPKINLESIAEMQSINQKHGSVGGNGNKVQPMQSIEDSYLNGGQSPLDSSQLNLNGHHRNFSADQDNIRNVPSRKNIYEQTISEDIFQNEGPVTLRESNDYFEFREDSEYQQHRHRFQKRLQIPDDESERSKFIKMPDVTASKTQLQEEIGYVLSKNTDENFKDEVRNKKDVEANSLAFYRIVDKDPIDVVNDYHDRCPCLSLRKLFMKARIIINRLALVIITNKYFETISIMVIIANSLFLALDDPLTQQQPAYQDVSESVFQYLYTAEMALKIIGYGFLFNKGAYLRDTWNILDFIIVISGYLSLILSGGGVNLSVLRSFRVIRPLRTISSIEGLRVIVQALVSSLPLLRDTILVLLFFFLIFAIAGVQLFSGALMNRCFDVETGVRDVKNVLCGGGSDCLPGQACGKTMENPNFGATNFDNIFYAFLQIFQTVTLEGWTTIMIAVEQTVGQWTIIFFIPIVFIGAFFLLNLTLAVIKSKFTEEHHKNKEKKNENQSKKKKPKIYGDESEEDDVDILNQGKDEAAQTPKMTKIQKRIKDIEENQEISPRSKRILKDKAKLEELLKRIDFAIKQRDVKDKITPRGSSVFSFSQGSLEHITSAKNNKMSKFNKKLGQSKLNYADIFNSRFFMNQLNEKYTYNSFFRVEDQDNQFNNSLVEFNTSLMQNNISKLNSSGLNLLAGNSKTRRRENEDAIKEDDQEHSYGISGLIDDEDKLDDKKYARSDEKVKIIEGAPQPLIEGGFNRTQTLTKNKVSTWLGQVFEIQKQPQQEDQPNSARLLMGGFAGIKTKQFSEKPNSEEIKRLKKEIYEKITKNFDVFDFFEDNNGDDEFSEDQFQDDLDLDNLNSYSSSRGINRQINEEELVQILDSNSQNLSPQNEVKYQRKSTMATVETKSVIKNRRFQFRDIQQQPQNVSESGIQPQNEQNLTSYVTGGLNGPLNDNTTFTTTHNNLRTSNGVNTLGKKKQIQRLATQSPQKNMFRNLKPIDDLLEEEDILKGGVKTIKPKRENSESFKQKAVKFMQGCTSKKKRRIEIIDTEVEELLKRSRSQQPSSKTEINRIKPLNLMQNVNRTQVYGSTSMRNNTVTVRALSENKKQLKLQEKHIRFKQKEEKMRQRRSKFFSQALKDIGKTPEQITKDLKLRAEQRRFIELKGGFTTTKKAKKNFLMRSGTQDFEKDSQKKESFRKNELSVDDYDEERSPSQNGVKGYEKELKQIQKEINKKKGEQDEVQDMDKILTQQKKKLIIRMKNYQFSSVNDIFEQRDIKLKESIHQNINSSQKQAFFLKDGPQTKTKKPKEYNPYQKKVLQTQKKYFEDLLVNEVLDSDDNQETILKRLEDEYNVDHRSNIHVTGTLSIVINKPHSENKILNKNYYDQINPQRKIDTILEEPLAQSMFVLSKEALSDNDSIIFQDQKSSRSHYINGNQSQELMPVQYLGGNTQRIPLKRTNTKLSGGSKGSNVKSALQKKNTVRPSSLHNDKRGQSSRIQGLNQNYMKNSNQSQKVKQGTQQSVQAPKEINYYLPRPEAFTDKQILKRLNDEAKKSRVFSSIHHSKLPKKIGHLGEEVIPLPEKKKKKKRKVGIDGVHLDTHREEDGDDEFSETSIDEPIVNNDYFIDRNLDYYKQILAAKHAAISRPIDLIEWSGQDIMQRFDPYKARIALDSLNKIRVWPKGFYGKMKRARVGLKKIIKSSFVDNLMTACVFANTVVLAIDSYGIDPATTEALTTCNTLFTIMFAVEMFLKILAVGITKYLRDKLNYMDGTIVILSMVELVFLSGKGALKALRSIRIIRAFRVLRVARLLRGLKSMMNIIAVIQRSISSFIYLALLLFLFIFIYALLGMQIFGGSFQQEGAPNRYNFDTFNQAFVTSFILLSTENWNTVMFFAFGSNVNKFISSIYFISCIFIGNFMLLNLFLAILLDSFTAVEEEDHDTTEKRIAREKQRIIDLESKEGEEFIQGLEGIDLDMANKIGNNNKSKKKKKKKKNPSSGVNDGPLNNILDESVEIDIETLNSKKQEMKEQKKVLFKGIECQKALYLFSQENKLRIKLYEVVTNSKFETLILCVIILSSFKLIFDTYTSTLTEDDPVVVISSQLDYVFTSIFTLELVMKCIAFGFIMDRNSYLRESWSQLDCFIVATSLIDATFSGVNLPIIKILRLLRILRPLRFISHNSSMKTVVVALLSSMGAILNVGIVVIVVFLMFAILGVNLFAGKLQYCSVNPYVVKNKLDCFQVRGQWKTFNQNFDNVPRAMITLFVVATQEGWPDVMYAYTDITGIETGPRYGESAINAYFFIAFVFIGSFFFMNLFVGVLFMNFEAAQRDEKEALLLDGDEMKWVDMMKMIVQTKPEIVKTPKNKISQFLFKHTKPETKFDFFIMICIILNMVQMAMSFEGQTVSYKKSLEVANYIFTGIFALEAILKFIANGTAYFLPGWHKFDIFVVFASFLDIVLNQLSTSALKPLRVAPQILRILRVLRVSRLFKLLNKAKGLQALIQTITFSLPSLFNVFALLLLVYFIFAVLGVFMYQDISQGTIIDPIYMNFVNFSQALIILLRISTGEDWPTIMYDTMNTDADCISGKNCGISYSPVFFIAFVMICSYVMLNLFVLIILQQFELYYLPQENILQQFREDLYKFKVAWNKFSKEFEGIKIRSLDLLSYFKDLDGNLGMKEDSEKSVMRNIVKMNLQCDEEGFIFFNELLFKAMKRIYGKERTKKRMLLEFELRTLDKLQQLTNKQQMKSRKNDRIKAVTVNPFLSVMYKNMSFKAWLKIFKTNIPKRNDEVEYNLDRESSEEEENQVEVEEYYYVTEVDESCHSDVIDEESSQNQSGEENNTRKKRPIPIQAARSLKKSPINSPYPRSKRGSSHQKHRFHKNSDNEQGHSPKKYNKQESSRQYNKQLSSRQHHMESQDLQILQEDQILQETQQRGKQDRKINIPTLGVSALSNQKIISGSNVIAELKTINDYPTSKRL